MRKHLPLHKANKGGNGLKTALHLHIYQPDRSVIYPDGCDPFYEADAPDKALMKDHYKPYALMASKGDLPVHSADFYPTVMGYLQENHPDVYDNFLKAVDDGRIEPWAGTWNHGLLPHFPPVLREAQIMWGLHDFRKRFGREPAGIWEAELALDTPSVDALVAAGYRRSIIHPRQLPWKHSIGHNANYRGLDLAVMDDVGHGSIAWGNNRGYYDVMKRQWEYIAPNGGQFQLLAFDSDLFGHWWRGNEPWDWLRGTWSLGEVVKAASLPETDRTQGINEGTAWSCMDGLKTWGDGAGGWKGRMFKRQQAVLKGAEGLCMSAIADAADGIDDAGKKDFLSEYGRVISGEIPESELFDRYKVPAAKRERANKVMRMAADSMKAGTSCWPFYDDKDGPNPKIGGAWMDLAEREQAELMAETTASKL